MNENGYVTIFLKGGLGNQLFQTCALFSYAKRTNRQIVFYDRDTIGNRPAYFSNFLSALKQYFIPQGNFQKIFKEGKSIIYEERLFEYVPILEYPPNVNVILNGYFQTDKYFKEDWHWIADILWGGRREEYISCYSSLLRNHVGTSSSQLTIALHFRVGDYVHNQYCHPVMNVEYYIRSLRQYLNDFILSGNDRREVEVLYFCEDFDLSDVMEKIDKMKMEFSSVSFRRAVVGIGENENIKEKDWREMILFGMCNAHIIPNSSFSWWGSYLGSYFIPESDILIQENSEIDENVHKPVYYPSVWFGPGLHWNNVKDLCPKNWHKIQA